MSRVLSQSAFQAMFAPQTGEVFLICLTLEHASFKAPIRVVHNNQKIERTAGTFYPALFEVNLPEESTDRPPQVQLTIENIDRSITDEIRSITGRVKITMDVVLASSPNTVEAGPFEFYLLSATYNAAAVQGTLGFEDDLLNVEFPKHRYTPVNSPGLFQ